MTALPEATCALIFFVAASSDIFGRTTHPPADVRKSRANFGEYRFVFGDHRDFEILRFGRRTIFPAPNRKETQPPACDFLVRPFFHDIRTATQNQVDMVAHHRVRQAINPENAGKKLKPVPNLLAPMLERFPRERIIPAQESSTNTTVHDMQDLNFIRINVFTTSLARHSCPLFLVSSSFLPTSPRQVKKVGCPFLIFFNFPSHPI